MEQLISQTSAAREGGNVVSIQDYIGDRKSGLRGWLYREACEQFGVDQAEDVVKNPLLRLALKYDGLNEEEQEQMFRYTEMVMAEQRGRRIGRKNILSELLNMGNHETWDLIEEYTDRLLSGAGVGKTDVHMRRPVTHSMAGMKGGAF